MNEVSVKSPCGAASWNAMEMQPIQQGDCSSNSSSVQHRQRQRPSDLASFDSCDTWASCHPFPSIVDLAVTSPADSSSHFQPAFAECPAAAAATTVGATTTTNAADASDGGGISGDCVKTGKVLIKFQLINNSHLYMPTYTHTITCNHLKSITWSNVFFLPISLSLCFF